MGEPLIPSRGQNEVSKQRKMNGPSPVAMFAFLTDVNAKAKRWLAAVTALILSVSFMLALQIASHSSHDMGLRFAGFRDNLDGPQPLALFWLTNRTDKDECWWLHHVSLKVDGDWKQDWKTYPDFLFREHIGPPEAGNEIRLVGIPVSATNVPVRAVFECLEKVPIRDNLMEFYENRVKHRSVYMANGRHYFVTNEVPFRPHGGANQRQPFCSDTNSTSGVAASRRSP